MNNNTLLTVLTVENYKYAHEVDTWVYQGACSVGLGRIIVSLLASFVTRCVAMWAPQSSIYKYVTSMVVWRCRSRNIAALLLGDTAGRLRRT